MAYSVLLASSAERQLKAFAEATQKRIVKRLKTLQHNPRPQGVKKLSGEDDLYRIREGTYQIIYTIHNKELIVLVVKIADRKEVCR
ncbi:MAG: type II toxin-antitoxin system RelE/ParE family toxin [Nitrospira sp.]|nr:type II toxin-antitoxin system RelE/ParE family toxin [Nitrospira sp.]